MAGLLACALAAGGLTAALTPGGGAVPGNSIGAGHLVLQVNHGQGSEVSLRNLAPGEQRTADQVLTADMAGVGTADLALTLSGAVPGPFAANASLSVSYSEPAPAGAIGWQGGTCTPPGGYPHTVAFARLADLAVPQRTALGTLTPTADAVCVRFEIGLGGAADNSVQDASTDLKMNYTLEQTSAGAP